MDFDWDDGNAFKAQKHGLTLSETEQALRTGARVAPDPAHSLSNSGSSPSGAAPPVARSSSPSVFGQAHPPDQRLAHMPAKEIARYEAAFRSEDDH
jgi:hypothetical protein